MNASTAYTSYRRINNEGGQGYNPHEAAMLAEADARASEREAWIDAHYDDLRAKWMAEVSRLGGLTDMQTVHAIERKVGITLAEVKAAKSRHTK